MIRTKKTGSNLRVGRFYPISLARFWLASFFLSSAYLVALSEPNPAVRRARLMDYQRTYPDSDRRYAIESQLDVINTAELGDWEVLYSAIYRETLNTSEKWSAMADYELRWNGSLLGGRGEELTALKKVLDTAKSNETQPDRTLEPGKSPIPDDIPDDRLAGAPPQKRSKMLSFNRACVKMPAQAIRAQPSGEKSARL